jgi:Sortilin, neurotensin receptor 3,
MPESYTILVGTVGNGVWRSDNSGESFAGAKGGIPGLDLVVRGFGVDPFDPQHVLVGTAWPVAGLHESHDGGATFWTIETFPAVEVWRITFDPTAQGRYFVGTRPSSIHRTEDGGKTFEKLKVELAETCPAVGVPRITSITLDPTDPSVMFSTIEVDGVRRSVDGGDTWEQVMTNIETPVPNANIYGEDGRLDCHFSVISPGDPTMVIVSTPDGPYVSTDTGKTWADLAVPQSFPRQYHREMAVKLDDPNKIFIGTGDFVNGFEGAMQRTRDRGLTWDTVVLPDVANSPVWCFAQHPSNADRILACTHKGMLFASEDGGESWSKVRREFSEVRGMCWLPH